MDAKENPLCPLISTWVRGAEIEVTYSSLAHDLQIPDVGFPFALLGDEEVGDSTYSYPVALQRLGLRYRLDEGKKSVVQSKQLGLRERVLVYLFGFNVFPRASGRNEVRLRDVFVLDKMLFGLGGRDPIPLAPIVINELRAVVASPFKSKAFCFPVLISQLIRRAGVSCSPETRVACAPGDMVTESTLRHLGFVHDGAVWRDPTMAIPCVPLVVPPVAESGLPSSSRAGRFDIPIDDSGAVPQGNSSMWESCPLGVSLSDHRRTRRRTVEAALLHLQTEHRDILAGQRALMERHQQIIDWQRAQDRRMQTQSDQLTWIIDHLRTRDAMMQEHERGGGSSPVLSLGSRGERNNDNLWSQSVADEAHHVDQNTRNP
ncbi:hypothetical protein Dimus_023694 [Dionaea muscipula]